MKQPYMALRLLMTAKGWKQYDIARIIQRKESYVKARMNNESSWTLEDAFRILKAAGLPDSKLIKFFPRDPMETVEFWEVQA